LPIRIGIEVPNGEMPQQVSTNL